VTAFGSVDALVHVVGGQQPRHWQQVDDFPLADLSDLAGFVTGQTVVVDDGSTIRPS
jgi:enoyl-[acyl-carrier-protein] reductase (NADH)